MSIADNLREIEEKNLLKAAENKVAEKRERRTSSCSFKKQLMFPRNKRGC